MRTARWICAICNRSIANTHMRRHIDAHVNQGIPRESCDNEWSRYAGVQRALADRRKS